MRGPDDPGEAKLPATEAKPPDPGHQTRRGGEEHEQRTLQVDNTGAPDGQAVQSITESKNGDDDGHMTLAIHDSIVAETPDSQEEVPVEDTGDDQSTKTDKLDPRSAPQTKAEPDRVGVMQVEQFTRLRDEWMATIAELFANAHDKVAIDEERVPAVKHRYPKLRGDERALLTTFFTEVFVVSRGMFADWDRYATAATRDLYNTSWSFKKILESLIDKVKWAREQPMNMWVAKIKAATTNEITRNGTTKKYQTFMFNPAKFSRADIETLMRICEQPVAVTHGRALRAGTKDEWGILAGMAEGNIVCRRVPEFAKSVLDSNKITRLNRTIQMQVEGELVLQLRGRGTISPSRRSTRAIKDDIMLAAVAAGVNLDEVQGMLNITKTISYNHVQRSVHFFCFDRVTARKYQLMYIQFQKQIYTLANVHGPDAGTVWDLQLAWDGTRPAMIREYETHAHVDTVRQRLSVEPSRYAELDDANEAQEEQEGKSEDKPPVPETIEISSGEELETERPSRITEEEKARLHLVSAKPQKLTPTPQLVALKQRERTALTKEITQLKQF
ncbi:hypothetical protein PR001_g2742 [Phytophthora rubi]|uniref:Uncharacterized protein n=1 Tax=Phytophthora rubi TaxID=129364 RepID=A0A6A3P7V6_9STRA|nr:hypothetical protein PR001_g2742 [Phytophthora rubi]